MTTTYRDIEIMPTSQGEYEFDVAGLPYAASTIADAQREIDGALAECFEYRGVQVSPGFEPDSVEFALSDEECIVQAPTPAARRAGAIAIIDAALGH